ncbi:MAG: hypothetical protein AB8B55_24805 [Mariniblastus sp.]
MINTPTAERLEQEITGRSWRARKSLKMLALYCTMVCVSTVAIFLLEHATLTNAFRTAIVAAIGKTLAASWVSGIFE